MYPHLFQLLAYPLSWNHDLLKDSTASLLTESFNTFTEHQKFTLLLLLTDVGNRDIQYLFYKDKPLEFFMENMSILSRPYRPQIFSETVCPVSLNPIIRETGLLYCALLSQPGILPAKYTYQYIADEGTNTLRAITKGVCPTTRGTIQWAVHLSDLDEDSLYSLIDPTNPNKLKTNLPDNWLDDRNVTQVKRELSKLNMQRTKQLGYENSGMIVMSLFLTSMSWRLVKKFPDFFAHISPEIWNQQVVLGTNVGLTPIQVMLETCFIFEPILLAHPEIINHITINTWLSAPKTGALANWSVFSSYVNIYPLNLIEDLLPKIGPLIPQATWNNHFKTPHGLIRNTFNMLGYCSVGREFLKKFPQIMAEITQETWNLFPTYAPDCNTFTYLCFYPELLLLYPKVLGQINVATWNSILSRRKDVGINPFQGLMQSPDGIQLVLDNPDVISKINQVTWNHIETQFKKDGAFKLKLFCVSPSHKALLIKYPEIINHLKIDAEVVNGKKLSNSEFYYAIRNRKIGFDWISTLWDDYFSHHDNQVWQRPIIDGGQIRIIDEIKVSHPKLYQQITSRYPDSQLIEAPRGEDSRAAKREREEEPVARVSGLSFLKQPKLNKEDSPERDPSVEPKL